MTCSKAFRTRSQFVCVFDQFDSPDRLLLPDRSAPFCPPACCSRRPVPVRSPGVHCRRSVCGARRSACNQTVLSVSDPFAVFERYSSFLQFLSSQVLFTIFQFPKCSQSWCSLAGLRLNKIHSLRRRTH